MNLFLVKGFDNVHGHLASSKAPYLKVLLEVFVLSVYQLIHFTFVNLKSELLSYFA